MLRKYISQFWSINFFETSHMHYDAGSFMILTESYFAMTYQPVKSIHNWIPVYIELSNKKFK